MATFAYRGYQHDGSEEAGFIEAGSRQEAAARLQQGGRRLFHLSEAAGQSKVRARRSFSLNRPPDFARLFGELALLLGAGFTVDKALRVVVEKQSGKQAREELQKVHDLVSEGRPVSDAFASIRDVPAEVPPLLASGERSGRIGDVCERLARMFDARARRRTAIVEAVTYPAFLVLVMAGSLVVLSTVLIPAIEPMFQGRSEARPLAVRVLSPLGDAFTGLVPMLPFAALVILGSTLAVSKSPAATARLARARLALPLVGAFIQRVSVIRYLETLSLQLGNGVPMPEALRLAGAAADTSMGETLVSIPEEVASGVPLHRAMETAGLFDRATLSLVAMGEEANRLPQVLDRATVMLEAVLTRRIARGVAMLTPALTLILGVLIGSLVLSVMSTILSVNDLALPG